MLADRPLLINLRPSNLMLFFLITVHVLAIVSILLLSDFGLAGTALKVVLIFLILASFRHFWIQQKDSVYLHLKAGNQANLIIHNQQYRDLKLSGESYISTLFMQLVFLDEQTNNFHNVMILPDSIDSSMRSQLRVKLKYSLSHD